MDPQEVTPTTEEATQLTETAQALLKGVPDWIITLAAAFLITVLLRVLLGVVRSRLTGLAKTTNMMWDDLVVHVLSKTKFYLIALAVFCYAVSALDLPYSLSGILNNAGTVLLLIQLGISATAASHYFLERRRQEGLKTDPASVSGYGAIRFLLNLFIWIVVFLLALDNAGVDVNALVAGLGVSGIAVALAVQNILGDLFASLTIILDRPFVVGDFLKVGSQLGTVESIGLKTTRFKSLSGEQIIFSNNDLLQSRIHNYGRLEVRRVSFAVGVTYQTSPESLAAIPGLIKEAVEKNEQAKFDRSHLSNFGDFAMVFETVYFVNVPDFAVYMDIQQAIYLDVARQFAERGIDFAYPTQTLYVHDHRLEPVSSSSLKTD